MRLEHLEHHLSPYSHSLQQSRIEQELKIYPHGEDGTCVPKLRNLLPKQESCWLFLHYIAFAFGTLGAKLLPCQIHFLSKACVCVPLSNNGMKKQVKTLKF